MFKPIYINGIKIDYLISDDGKVFSSRRNKFLTPVVKNGYMVVLISDTKNGIRKNLLIHRLVAEAFIPNPDNLPQVNHIDGVKSNNHVTNLEWVTPKENTIHAFAHGLRKPLRGSKNPSSKHDEKTVIRICELLDSNKYTSKEIATMCNVTTHFVANIKTGVAWKHISSRYKNIKKVKKRFVKFYDYVQYLVYSGLSGKEIINILVTNEGLKRKEAYYILARVRKKDKFLNLQLYVY